ALLPILPQPLFQIRARFSQLILIDQAPPERFEIGPRADIESQFIVRLVGRALGGCDEQLFVKRGQPALYSAQAQMAFARDGPVRQSERQVIERFGFEVSQQRLRERVFEIRIDHIGAVFQHGGDEAEEPAFRIIFINEAVSGRRLDAAHDLADLVDIDFVRELSPEDYSGLRETLPDRARRFDARQAGHLNVEDAELRAFGQSRLDYALSVGGFEDRSVFGELAFEQFAQVSALRHIIFGNQNGHSFFLDYPFVNPREPSYSD